MARILFVLSGADHWTLSDGSAHPTGFWAEEAVAPYRAFKAAGHTITVATPGGVVPTADPASLAPDANGGQQSAELMAASLARMDELRHPLKLSEVDAADYDAVFYPGGHGPMEDLVADRESGALLTAALNSGKPLGVVCHGPAALLATRRADGSSPFSGYALTAFTNTEENQAGLAERAPWLLQDRLMEMGVHFREGDPWAPKVVVDRNLYTGQNPASAAPLADRLVEALRG
ncbi:type 1 glutamine amidotransferase domain-containing protein [Streptomyces iconiensis]|uniref:Type 1 glutamine amidotransferase domain-containing protein n=1 Tax=Streptomyces iconiensis TaxID=1384038 RepID=A0ABT7A6X0_9ACTN|nr:type 1 glutamine amidotransferase domain-containing protein [Streptomyces iconiensis]MDJ1137090.1 type 1 glutamine amidotransferase domain-containing protein [Streptomyces iconiensis]